MHRLRNFVSEYHKDSPQCIDDVYQGFVWSLLVGQASIRVGVLPLGQQHEVYIPPQPRAPKNKEKTSEPQQETTSNGLQLVEGVESLSFQDLVQQFGDRLRIAVDSQTTCTAITGSHIRVSFMEM